jgi:Spy/CpxP family protein refolding chaperone
MMRRAWLGAVLPGFLVGSLMMGCEETPPAQSPPGSAEITGGKAPAPEDQGELWSHHRHHQGGFVGFVMNAVETIGVTPEQQAAIDKIKADFKAKVEPVRAANAAIMTALADQIAAGAVDVTKLQPQIDAVSAAAAQVHGATADALNQLHAVLRPEQRMPLVDKVDAHFAIWKEANAEQAADPKHDAHITLLAKELGLTPDQVEKGRASMAAARAPFDTGAAEAHMKAFALAFPAASFDAKALTTADAANTKIAAWGVTRMVNLYQALTPVLSQDQRTKIANQLKEHANEP